MTYEDINLERLPDVSDMATLREGQFLDAALNEARNAKPIEATGRCLFCNAEVADGLRFCDVFCRDDWDHHERMKTLNGR